MTLTVSNQSARRFFIASQGLADGPHLAWGDGGLAAAIERLGFVQVDSINIVERAHHHILFARSQTYRPRHLARLVERDRVLFENWTHDASVVPSAFYPYWKHRFARERTRLRERRKDHFGREGFDDDLARVRDRVRNGGPVMTRDFEGDKPSTGWWDWHPSKAALEYLWLTGELAITRREGFQKVYDLAERVIPAEHYGAEVGRDEFVDWACRGALARLGFATRGEIAAFWKLVVPAEVDEWLEAHRGELVTVVVESANGSPPRRAFAFPDIVARLAAAPEPPARLRILSPFDPLLRDRNRAERLFGFFYRIEVFVPEAKRKYGYYVFPVLRGDRIVGRIDMKADRATDRMDVRAFWPEPGIRMSAALIAALEADIARLGRLAGVSGVSFADGWMKTA